MKINLFSLGVYGLKSSFYNPRSCANININYKTVFNYYTFLLFDKSIKQRKLFN